MYLTWWSFLQNILLFYLCVHDEVKRENGSFLDGGGERERGRKGMRVSHLHYIKEI